MLISWLYKKVDMNNLKNNLLSFVNKRININLNLQVLKIEIKLSSYQKSVLSNIRLGILSVVLPILTVGCVHQKLVDAESFKTLQINSADWINPKYNGLHTDIVVKQIEPRLLSFDYSFNEIPLDPVNGIDPTALYIFQDCVSAKLALQRGYSRWHLGFPAEDLLGGNSKFKQLRKLKTYIGFVSDNDSLPSILEGNDIKWSDMNEVYEGMFERCSDVLRPQFMWKKGR